MDTLLVYGSYGYTGRLIVRDVVARGGTPIVAGRDDAAVTRQADDLGVDARAFDLEADVAARIRDVDAVLNCAGPFVNTAEPLVEACLETGTDYLDVTGEFQVFERLRRYDGRARDADVTLLPGVGFDVVPSDCLAAFLHERLPAATHLSLGIKSGSSPSRGTARTLVEHLGAGGVVRHNGRLVEVPTAYRTREIDFGDGPEHAVTIPWGDVVTAGHSTGIDSIEVYGAAPVWATRAMAAFDRLDWLLERRSVERALRWLIDARVDGPDEEELATDRATVWGEVRDERTDRRARARLETPNPYTLTVDAAVTAADRLLDDRDRVAAGFQTPSSAFGHEFVRELEGTELELLLAPLEAHGSDLESGD